MTRWQRCLQAAGRAGRSVATLAPGAAELNPPEDALHLGIKDTWQIGDELRQRLATEPGLAWLTVDRAAPGGRAVDTGLVNPLTGRPMTGSTSGGPVNIWEGFLDACVGTDGGGSVLGPALATGLAGVIGSGIGLLAPGERVSTDGLPFHPGYGVIGRDWAAAKTAFAALLRAAGGEAARVEAGLAFAAPAALTGLTAAVSAAGSVRLPDGSDMAAALEPYAAALRQAGVRIQPLPMVGIGQRERALSVLRQALGEADMVVTLEGPVDVYGLGDSILGSLGEAGAALQAAGGKYLLRAANMAGATAVALPVPRLASGLILCGRTGLAGAAAVFAAAELLIGEGGPAGLPPLVRRYIPRL